MNDELLKILACPSCKGPLDYNEDKQQLVCNSCRLIYRIENEIPIMLVDEAEKF